MMGRASYCVSACSICEISNRIWAEKLLQAGKVSGSSPDDVIEFLSIDLTLPAALGPRVHSASNRNYYQKIFLEVKRGRLVWMRT
jgi:hypothetical protein